MSQTPPRAVTLLLLASLVLGFAHIALLPPFEGFDETGHYSYIQQLAETGRWPRAGDKMSKDVGDYLNVAPGPDSIAPPWSYYRFFADGARTVAIGRDAVHSVATQPRSFVPGGDENWLAQHPPLYYFLVAPIYLVTKSLSLAGQLFVLRAFSYLLAWSALCIVAIAILRGTIPNRRMEMPVLFAISAWPLLFPMWFPEMARLGNDSLIAVFAACLYVVAFRVTTTAEMRGYGLLGVILGLALLTKATFLPATAAILSVLGLQALFAHEPGARARRIKGICITVAIAFVIGGWWYALKLIETGSLIGSTDVVRMNAVGGIAAGLKKLSLYHLFEIPWGFTASFLWAGTWSFVLPPRVYLLPLVALVALIAFGAYRALRRQDVQPVEWFSLLALGLFLAALTYHSVVVLSTVGGGAAAWYLHSVAPVLILLVGAGIAEVMRVALLRGALMALSFYPLMFFPAMTVMNALYFAGCAEKLPERFYFARATGAECLADAQRMIENLSVLAFPRTGIVLFILGWLLAVFAIAMAVRSLSASGQISITSTR